MHMDVEFILWCANLQGYYFLGPDILFEELKESGHWQEDYNNVFSGPLAKHINSPESRDLATILVIMQ